MVGVWDLVVQRGVVKNEKPLGGLDPYILASITYLNVTQPFQQDYVTLEKYGGKYGLAT